MTIAEITAKIIAESNGNIHDIEHLLKVYAYARTLGELEALDAHTQFVLEAAALLHDIACPLCREKYGSCPGNLQEAESKPLVEAFLKDSGMPQDDIDRIAWIVSHHHTYGLENGADYQLLL